MYIVEYYDSGMDVRHCISDDELSLYLFRFPDMRYIYVDWSDIFSYRNECKRILDIIKMFRDNCYAHGLENESWYIDYLDELNRFSL